MTTTFLYLILISIIIVAERIEKLIKLQKEYNQQIQEQGALLATLVELTRNSKPD